MHALFSFVATLASIGQIGPKPQPPVVTIAELSLPASENSAALPLCVYKLHASTAERPLPTAAEVVTLLHELIAPATWKREGVYLRAINDRLVVRQSPEVQRQIFAVLVELELIIRPRLRHGRPWLESVIPVVGQRPKGRSDRSRQ